jgi:carnitine-CoA ligase
MNIPDALDKQVQRNPNKIFLYFEEEKITYMDFNRKSNRVANAFKKMGVNKGEMVAIMLPNSPAFLYTWIGLNKIGAVETPINVNLKEPEIKYILQHSRSSGIIIHENYYPIFNNIPRSELSHLKFIVFYGDNGAPSGTIPFSELLKIKSELGNVFISEDDPAVCIYTSGTTDRPKGVLNSHKSWVLTGEGYAYTVDIKSEDRVMTPNPLFHANAQVYSTMGSLMAGASLILLKRFSSSRILDQARYYGATKMILVQAVTPWIWNRPRRQNDGDNSVNTMVAGNVPIEIYTKFEKRFNLKIQTIYSLTEAVFAIMAPREGTKERKPGGVGVPMEHPEPSIINKVRIIDDRGFEVPRGKHGEIIIKNPATMIGYFKDPKRTAETKRDGWIHTGDIGYQDEDGYFFFVGRQKEVIRRRGELISPTEIEGIINSHESVLESAVVGVPSNLGQGEEEVKAYVILRPGENIAPGDIISWCTKKLAEFKIPRYIEFRDNFPKNAIGRIQKYALKQKKQ